MSKTFYVSAEVWGNKILYRGVEDGRLVDKEVSYEPTLFVRTDSPSELKTLKGEPVRPITFPSIKAAKDYIEKNADIDNHMIYGDIGYDTQYIADTFPDEIDYDLNLIQIVDIDIEVAVTDKFPEPKLAEDPINAVTIKHRNSGTIFSFGTGPANPKTPKTYYQQMDSEFNLLVTVMRVLHRLSPHIISGWNVRGFDIPYLINRIRKEVGEGKHLALSPFGAIREDSFIDKFGKKADTYKIYGVQILDGLELYRKNVLEPRPNHTLDTIGFYEVGRGKLDYSNYGSLHLLWKEDFPLYIEYNIEDTVLVGDIDAARKLIDLTITQAYAAKINFETVSSQTRMWDAIIYNYLRKMNIVIPPKVTQKKDRKFRGAYVKDIHPGHYKWVVSYDFASLYPSIIQQLNVSPETMGQFIPRFISVEDCLDQRVETKRFHDNNLSFSPNGQTFHRGTKGFLSMILSDILSRRKVAQKEMKDAKKKLVDATDPSERDHLQHIIAERDVRQKALKVAANSCYGALGNQYFRYFDLNMAEAITLYGQFAIQWIERSVNRELESMFGTPSRPYVLAMDTDSCYLELDTIVSSWRMEGREHEIVQRIDDFCTNQLDVIINKAIIEIFEYSNAFENHLSMKREVISEAAVWRGKKNYAMIIWDNEGVRYKEPELKIMGLEPVKSSTPLACKKWITEAIRMCLTGRQNDLYDLVKISRNEFEKLPINEIAYPKTVSSIDKYLSRDKEGIVNGYKKGTPINSRGAIVFNKMLTEYGLSAKYEPIKEGDKVKSLYLVTPNPAGENTIAYKTVLPEEFGLAPHIDYGIMFDKFFVSPVQSVASLVGFTLWPVYTLESLME